MATSYGPQYPGIQDGLVFCFDPKNKDCWKGGRTIYPISSKPTNNTGSMATDFSDAEINTALTTEGYFTYDGSDDRIDCGTEYNSSLQFSNPYSISTWVDLGGSGDRTMVANLGSNYEGVQIRGITGDKIRWVGAMQNGSVWFYVDSSALSSGWHHVVGTYNGSGHNVSNLNLYINGVLDNNATGTSGTVTTNTSTAPLYMGYGGVAYPTQFNGDLGPCMIYNRELSAAEVMTNYNILKGRFGL